MIVYGVSSPLSANSSFVASTTIWSNLVSSISSGLLISLSAGLWKRNKNPQLLNQMAVVTTWPIVEQSLANEFSQSQNLKMPALIVEFLTLVSGLWNVTVK